MGILWRALVVVAITCAGLLGSREARACGHGGNGYGLEGLAYVAAAGAVVGATVVVVDATFTAYDIGHAAPSSPPSASWSGAERYVATPQVIIGALVGFGVVSKSAESLPTVLAWTAWPAALAAHGYYAHAAEPYGEGWKTPVVVMGVLDGALAVYDLGMMVRGERPDDVYVIGELVGALPQTLFGLAFVAQSSGRDARTAMLLTALPAALSLHAIFELAFPASHADEGPPPEKPIEPIHALAPTLVVQGTYGPVPGLGLAGAF